MIGECNINKSMFLENVNKYSKAKIHIHAYAKILLWIIKTNKKKKKIQNIILYQVPGTIVPTQQNK